MARMTGPDCGVMCNLINTHTHARAQLCVHLCTYYSTAVFQARDNALDICCPCFVSRLWCSRDTPAPPPPTTASHTHYQLRDDCRVFILFLVVVSGIVSGGTLFEELGYYYVGPVDGHDLDNLVPILENIRDKKDDKPVRE